MPKVTFTYKVENRDLVKDGVRGVAEFEDAMAESVGVPVFGSTRADVRSVEFFPTHFFDTEVFKEALDNLAKEFNVKVADFHSPDASTTEVTRAEDNVPFVTPVGFPADTVGFPANGDAPAPEEE